MTWEEIAPQLWIYVPLALLLLAALIAFGFLPPGRRRRARLRLERQVVVGPLTRSYILRLPENYHKRDDLRLLIVFHPALATGAYMELHTKFHALPESRDFVVAYPDGFGRTWNAGSCCGPAYRQNIDDIGFFEAIVEDVRSLARVRNKVYLAGFSNGALLAYHIAFSRSQRVAAIATFAAYLPPRILKNYPEGEPVPLLHIHGDADKGAPVEGGMTSYLGELPPALETVKWVARRNGCDLQHPRRIEVEELDTTCTQFVGPDASAEATLCIVPGLGHVWPGAEETHEPFGPARPELQGSRVVLEFFLNH